MITIHRRLFGAVTGTGLLAASVLTIGGSVAATAAARTWVRFRLRGSRVA